MGFRRRYNEEVFGVLEMRFLREGVEVGVAVGVEEELAAVAVGLAVRTAAWD